jgi:hypothetical protein
MTRVLIGEDRQPHFIDDEQCATCRYWVRQRVESTALEAKTGDCRKRAPSPAWPTTNEDAWCGEHEQAQ